MSSRSLLLQLPRDILHSVYSEWLSSWRDLSCLDVGCVGEEDREAWLCSLSELRMISMNRLEGLSDESMVRWYEWVISRKVLLVEMFPMPLSVFANLTTELDYGSYCPSMRSIEIINDLETCYHSHDSSLLNVLEERLYLFLKECSHLEGVRYIVCGCYKGFNDSVFSVLRSEIKANTLQSVVLNLGSSGISSSTPSLIRQFLVNQLSSMQELSLFSDDLTEECANGIMSILREKTTPLTVFHLSINYISLHRLSGWLSSVAMHLQELGIGMVDRVDFIEEEMWVYLGKSYPQLRWLRLGLYEPLINQFTSGKLLQLYQMYPNLISFYCYDSQNASISIFVDDLSNLRYDMRNLMLMREEKELFLECLCLVIQRSQCKLMLSNQAFCSNLVTQHDDWVLFKSKLSPYLTDLVGVMSESILIEAVKGLPRLEKLIVHVEKVTFSDLSLTVIMEYGYGLQKLFIHSTNPQYCRFSDEMMAKVIERCEMLEQLNIPGAGYESVLAVKHHSRLKVIHLFHVIISKEDMASILFDERESEDKYAWRLGKGHIYGKGYGYKYIADMGSWQAQL